MSRKAFLIWGLVFIQFNATLVAVAMYLSLSKIVVANAISPSLGIIQLLVTLFGFGFILHLRFKIIDRRKRILALCFVFYFLSQLIGGVFQTSYLMSDIFGAHDRLFGAIGDWAALDDPKPASPFNTIRKLDYVVFSLPTQYLQNWGLFALLWFGSIDPRTPSKNKFIRFIKHGFPRKSESSAQTHVSELAHP